PWTACCSWWCCWPTFVCPSLGSWKPPHAVQVTSASAGRLSAAPGCGSGCLRDRGRRRREGRTPYAARRLPREPVRVGEGAGIAADDDSVRAGAVRGDAGVLGQRAAPVERQL